MKWIIGKVEGYIKEYGYYEDMKDASGVSYSVGVREFVHPWKQGSIVSLQRQVRANSLMLMKIFYAQVFRLAPANATNSDSITIVGAHQDSMNYKNVFDAAPGADDDGSGTVTILEALRGQYLSPCSYFDTILPFILFRHPRKQLPPQNASRIPLVRRRRRWWTRFSSDCLFLRRSEQICQGDATI
jgi:hypothetical protein